MSTCQEQDRENRHARRGQLAQTRIQIDQYTPRWDDDNFGLTEALDFWSAATAAANVAMQMCHPGDGYGVVESRVESGALVELPWKQLSTTPQYMAPAVLGTDAERDAYREAINVRHRQVRSTADSPVKYNEQAEYFWFIRTLAYSVVMAVLRYRIRRGKALL